MKTPCKGCMSRHAACHTECEKYLAFRADTEKRRLQRRAEAEIDNARHEMKDRSVKRATHGKNRGRNK